MQPQGSLKTNHPKAWSSPCRISIREGIRSGSSGRKEQVLTHSEWLFTKQAHCFPPGCVFCGWLGHGGDVLLMEVLEYVAPPLGHPLPLT